MLEILQFDWTTLLLAGGFSFKSIWRKPSKIFTAPFKATGKAVKQSVRESVRIGKQIAGVAGMGGGGEAAAPALPAIPAKAAAAPTTAAVPTQALARRKQRRAASKTILTGPRGLAPSSSVSSGKKLFGA